MNEIVNGPWTEEPDRLDWIDERTGLRCCILRVEDSGHLCGYVELPEGHPLAGLAYNEAVPETLKPIIDAALNGPVGKRGAIDVFCMAAGGDMRAGYLFDVHGGITFSGGSYWADEKAGNWYGFDCAHAGDLCPERARRYGGFNGDVYRDIEYVKAECASLAQQINAMVA